MLSLTYFFSQKDAEQESTVEQLQNHCRNNGLVFVDICIDDNPELTSKYTGKTPTICIGPYVLHTPYTETDLKVATQSALSRQARLEEEGDDAYKKRVKNGVSINNLDRFSYFFSRYYVLVLSLLLSLFIAIPFLAPVLEKTGHTTSATVIYKVYRVICHQLAFRSFFFYGEQPIYPRELAHIDNLITYEQITNSKAIDLEYARDFVGNELLGYKIAICERDVAIYGSLALFGFFFQLTNRKVKQLPWYLWFIIALIPIALDGFTQIPSLAGGWPVWVPVRESTPFLRVLTGTLFGLGTGWYMYPMMEESMKETRITLHRKFAIINKINQAKKMVLDESNN
ncbi:MAG: hypothetical protein C0410_05900 [Anaerolinea sp.]|nr:hypothetical protein [Anaerolinea sp.]